MTIKLTGFEEVLENFGVVSTFVLAWPHSKHSNRVHSWSNKSFKSREFERHGKLLIDIATIARNVEQALATSEDCLNHTSHRTGLIMDESNEWSMFDGQIDPSLGGAKKRI